MQGTGDPGRREIRGNYLIAADGGHSRVRTALGVDYEGRGAFSNSLTIYFTANLSPYIGGKAYSLIYVNNATLRGFFRLNRAATAGFLGVNVIGDPELDPEAAVNAAADVLMPPNGGFGGNTGIHDTHNLAGKLALVINGRAGPGLLDTYETERRPVAAFTGPRRVWRSAARRLLRGT
jgi:2-polyprenyl-6-methoxyphenol hydroxylase-like FAD-dependent oxidoreductase